MFECFIIDDTNSKEERMGCCWLLGLLFAVPAHLIQGDDTWGEPGQCRAHYDVISGVINGYIRSEKNQLLILLIIIFICILFLVLSLQTKIL